MSSIKLDQADALFDSFTCFPLVSTITGSGRVIYGLVELITGLIKSIIFGVKKLIVSDNELEALEKKFEGACVHIFFGSANIVRGVVEAIPLVNLLVFGYDGEMGSLRRKNWEVVQTA